MVVFDWSGLLLTTDRTPTRSEDHASDLVLPSVLEEKYRARHVHPDIKVRLAEHASHVHLGGLMRECPGPNLLGDILTACANVRLVEAGSLRRLLTLAGRELVYDGDLVTTFQEMLSYVRADKTGTAGNQNFHRLAHARW